jgi:hypothetical protein
VDLSETLTLPARHDHPRGIVRVTQSVRNDGGAVAWKDPRRARFRISAISPTPQFSVFENFVFSGIASPALAAP